MVVVVVIVVVVVVSQQDGQQHPTLELKNKKTSPDFQGVNNFKARYQGKHPTTTTTTTTTLVLKSWTNFRARWGHGR